MGNYIAKKLLLLFLILNFALNGIAQNNTALISADSIKGIPDTLLFRIQTALLLLKSMPLIKKVTTFRLFSEGLNPFSLTLHR